MTVKFYGGQSAAEAVARLAPHLSGTELCTISVLYPAGFPKMACSLAGFGAGIVKVRTSPLLHQSASVEISVGHAMKVFGTVCGEAEPGDFDSAVLEVVITGAVVRESDSV